MKIAAIIPARYESTRFRGKPLAPICGKPMIQWVYEAARHCDFIDQVFIATDHEQIPAGALAKQGHGGESLGGGHVTDSAILCCECARLVEVSQALCSEHSLNYFQTSGPISLEARRQLHTYTLLKSRSLL